MEMKDDVPTGTLIINKKGEFLEDVTLADTIGGWISHIFEYITGALKDVTFEVYALEDIQAADSESEDYYKKDELIATITTDETGIAKLSDLPLGRYYVKEKEPEPGAVRKGTSQPELDARSHEEVIPRNDAAEKQNEIPGRQIPSQTDPLVEIRSAVHSNYAGMVAMLGADNRVYLGREERCHYQNMQPSYYDNQDGSLCFVCDQPTCTIFSMEKAGRIPRRKCWNEGLPCASMKNLQDCKMGSLHSLPPKEKFCLPDSHFRRRRVICAMQNFMRKVRPATTICWMAG